MTETRSSLPVHIREFRVKGRPDLYREPFSWIITNPRPEDTALITTHELSILAFSSIRNNLVREGARRYLPPGTFIHVDNIAWLDLREGIGVKTIALKRASDHSSHPSIIGYILANYKPGKRFKDVLIYR